jgi:hypothetical protein
VTRLEVVDRILVKLQEMTGNLLVVKIVVNRQSVLHILVSMIL